MTALDLDALAEQLFRHFENHDLDAVGEMLATGAVITQNGRQATWTEFRPLIEGFRDILGDHRYADVRRVIGDHAVVEEHAVVATSPGGNAIRLEACVVIRVDDAGRITSLDEYVDTSRLA